MKRLTCLFALFLLVGIAPGAWAGAKEEIEQADRQFIQAFNEGNAEAVGTFYAEDAHLTPIVSPFRVEGREAIQVLYAGFFRAFPVHRVVIRQPSIRVYNGTTAVTSAYYTLTLINKAGKARRVHARASLTRVKLGGRWLIVNHHSSRLPAPG
ncbi:MAG: SgcJ/EcaC family oxidoreductase [Anaerolineae bacterium]